MGPAFAALPPLVRAIHDARGDGGAAEEGLAMRFGFALAPAADGLTMILRRWSMLGVRLTLFLAPRIVASERERTAASISTSGSAFR